MNPSPKKEEVFHESNNKVYQNNIQQHEEKKMKRLTIYIVTFLFIASASTSAFAGSEKISHSDLFKEKCTSCHKGDRAKKLHLNKKGFLEIIKKMKKKGAAVTDKESDRLADFLSNPSRTLFEKKCITCHGIAKIEKAHKNNRLTKDTIKRMQKNGADISDKEANQIYDYLTNYQFVPPLPPVSPSPVY